MADLASVQVVGVGGVDQGDPGIKGCVNRGGRAFSIGAAFDGHRHPAEADGTVAPPPANATPPSESSGINNMEALAIGAAILVVAGGVAFFMWRRSGTAPHGSLITSAMNELKNTAKNEDKDEDKREEKYEEKPIEKKEEKKFPPPMT